MTTHQTVAHDSTTCRLGPDGGKCEMCTFAEQSHPSFNSAWNTAPTAMKRVTEMECAEYFYRCGVRDGAREAMLDLNEILRSKQE